MSDQANFIIGVQFTRLGKIYYFKANDDRDLVINDHVLVETSRGMQYARVAQLVSPEDEESAQISPKPIVRRARAEDIEKVEYWKQKEKETTEQIRSILRENRIKDVKVVNVEHGYNGESLSLLISSLNDEKVNINPIRDILLQRFRNMNINIRQVGPRDVAKIYGGLGACGLGERCCSQFLHDFNSISIRMAKEQEISLTPEEITGMCGRLRCCLEYEYEQYKEGRQGLPKKGKWVETADGVGKVSVVLPLRSSVLVDFPGSGVKEYSGDQVTVTQRPPQPPIDETPARRFQRPGTRVSDESTAPGSEETPDKPAHPSSGDTHRRDSTSGRQDQSQRPRGKFRPPRPRGSNNQ